MSDRPAFPPRFRRRVAVTFVAVGGLCAGALALGAAVTVHSYRNGVFEDRAMQRVRDDMALVAAGAHPELLSGRRAEAEQPGGPAVVVVEGGQVHRSVASVSLQDVPPELRDALRDEPNEVATGRVEIDSGAALVIGAFDQPSGTEAYFFFSREELERSLAELRVTLFVGWVIVVLLAAAAGVTIARRILRPVQTAADAARSVAEGLLDTRLPVHGADEFGDWALAFNEMVDGLEQKLAALGEARDREQRFSADIAHELRTPIAAILTTASHLATEPFRSDAERRAATEIVLAAARRLDRLTSELLELHRLETGHERLNVEAIDVAAAVLNAVAAHGWTDHVIVEAGGPTIIDSDRRRLDRIIVNLIGNAIEHGGGSAVVRIEPQGGAGSIIRVTDRGPGIPPDALARLFDRHFKVNTHRASGASGGSGLGLSIAFESAQRLGGSLTVDSVLGEGTTFVLILPPAPADEV